MDVLYVDLRRTQERIDARTCATNGALRDENNQVRLNQSGVRMRGARLRHALSGEVILTATCMHGRKRVWKLKFAESEVRNILTPSLYIMGHRTVYCRCALCTRRDCAHLTATRERNNKHPYYLFIYLSASFLSDVTLPLQNYVASPETVHLRLRRYGNSEVGCV